jgi:hypothetical protein
MPYKNPVFLNEVLIVQLHSETFYYYLVGWMFEFFIAGLVI